MKHSNNRHLMQRYRLSIQRHRRSMQRHRRSMRRHRVSGDISDCGVCITPQMCNRVTYHGDMGIFPNLSHRIFSLTRLYDTNHDSIEMRNNRKIKH